MSGWFPDYVVTCVVCAWLPIFVASRLKSSGFGPLNAAMPIGVATGYGLAGLQWFASSLHVSLWTIALLAAAGFVVGRAKIAQRQPRWFRLRTLPMTAAETLVWIAVATVVLSGIAIIVRPHLSYDVLSYHLPLANRLAAEFGLQPEPGNYYSRLPMGAAALEALFVDKDGAPPNDWAVRLLTWVVFAASVITTGDVARRLGAHRAAALVAMLLVATHPLSWKTLLNAYTDGVVILYALGAVWCWHRSAKVETLDWSWAIACGFLAGSAMSVKFSAVGVVVLPLGLMVAVDGLTRCRRCATFKGMLHLAGYGSGVLLAYLPWLVRNGLQGFHPLHPFIGTAPGWSREQAAFLVNEHDPRSVFSLAYWRGLVEGLWVFDVDLLVGGGAVLLPVALMLAVSGVYVARRRAPVAMTLLVALLGYAAWRTVGLAPDRFVMAPVFLVMILAAMAAWPRRAHKLWRIGAGGLLLVAWMATVIPNRDLYRVAWYPEAWSREGMIPSRFLDSVWKDVGEDDRVLLLFEARARLFPRNSEITTVWDVPPWFPLLREAEDEVAFERALADAGYTHLVVNEVEWGRLVDFYGDLDRKLAWDVFSVGLRPNEVEALLRAYPPMKHAKATDAEIARLAEWLRVMRERAAMVESMGSRAELWWAPINAGS